MASPPGEPSSTFTGGHVGPLGFSKCNGYAGGVAVAVQIIKIAAKLHKMHLAVHGTLETMTPTTQIKEPIVTPAFFSPKLMRKEISFLLFSREKKNKKLSLVTSSSKRPLNNFTNQNSTSHDLQLL